MPSTTLTILGDASGARAAIAGMRAEYERAVAAISGRTQSASTGSGGGRRPGADPAAEARRQEREVQRERQRALLARRREEEAAARQREKTAKAEAQAAAKAERDKTRVAAKESALRVALAAKESKAKEKAANDEAREAAKVEHDKTRTAEREEKNRTRLAVAEAKARSRAVERVERENRAGRRAIGRSVESGINAVGGAALSAAGNAHNQIQDARERAAARETELNSTLVQLVPSGASAAEIADTRREVMRQIVDARLTPENVIGALAGAQSFANALGGDTAARRRTALNNTMADVRFASLIDPEHTAGLVRVGAVARQGGMNAEDARLLLRSAAGIGFQGSVETDQMITRGLPGLQEAWSAGTAGLTDPAQISARRAEIARDFMAQVQSQAASGRTVTVSARRTNTVRQALGNDFRQDQLGQAYAARRATMTAEQRAAFDANFTRGRDGRYSARSLAEGSASDIARFFGTMHNNDATQMRNFLGAHGGGGARQLMNTPDVSAIASYFATVTNARGQQVRQYDYTGELSRSMITPEQERTIADVRNAEDSKNLNANENARIQALTDNTGELRRFSDSLASWASRNPLLAPAAAAAAPLAIKGIAKGAGALLTTGAGAATAAGLALAGSAAIGVRGALSGRTLTGDEISTPRRILAAANPLGEGGREVGEVIGRIIADSFRANPPVVIQSPHDEQHAASQRAGATP